jgi:molybdopterin molybdotransferase
MAPETTPDWLSVAAARRAILDDLRPLPAERRPLPAALGRVLAEELVSPLDLPLWPNSGMDGFAVRAEDVRGASAAGPSRPARSRRGARCG